MRDVQDFAFLEKGMSYQQIVERVGEPDQQIGTGVYVYVYKLSDGGSVGLSFISLDSLYSAQVQDASGNTVQILVAP